MKIVFRRWLTVPRLTWVSWVRNGESWEHVVPDWLKEFAHKVNGR